MYELASAVLVAAGERRELDPNIVRPGWIALAIFLAMAAALALLMWSFARISRKARAPWEGEESEQLEDTPDGPISPRS